MESNLVGHNDLIIIIIIIFIIIVVVIVIVYLSNRPHFLWVYRRDNPRGMLGEHEKKLVNHEPKASDLQAFRVCTYSDRWKYVSGGETFLCRSHILALIFVDL